VKGVEAGMYRAEEIQDDIKQPLITKPGENSSSSDDSTDSDQGTTTIAWEE
jgi:hypothetical protein